MYIYVCSKPRILRGMFKLNLFLNVLRQTFNSKVLIGTKDLAVNFVVAGSSSTLGNELVSFYRSGKPKCG